jgi:hypothetical protein
MIGRVVRDWRGRAAGAALVLVATTVVAALVPQVGSATSVAGSAGIDTALPATDSAVTVSGRGSFANLKVTVNQTKQLLNQAVSVTWTGAPTPLTSSGGTQVDGNFLEIFQCWGDPSPATTVAGTPGPPPDNCEFGGNQSNPKFRSPVSSESEYSTRIITRRAWPDFDRATPPCTSGDGKPTVLPLGATCVSAEGLVWMPFRAVDGTVTNASANLTAANPYSTGQGGFWLNPSFTYYSTNEDDAALTHGGGVGSELFSVDTGLEAPGLGCGQVTQPLPDGTKKTPQCWLVIVPRGTASQENPPGIGTAGSPVETSPLTATSWQNRIAIPLDFKPVDSSCRIGADERRIAGSELASPAITNWQPTLCSTPGAPPYNYVSISDNLARSQLTSGVTGAPGMAVTSQPIDPTNVDPSNPVVYAPLTLSGVAIGFNLERVTGIDQTTGLPTDPGEVSLSGIRVAKINLTPRLVAKMLAESYQYQFIALSLRKGAVVPKGYEWYLTNPTDVVADPDFLQYNPEFRNLKPDRGVNTAHLVVEQPTADAANELWRWVLADPEAAQWLAGTPDPWGMRVNPVYSTNPAINPSGTGFATPVPYNFPVSDPFCMTDAPPLTNGETPRALCMLDVAPYVNSMQVAALDTRVADDGAKTTEDVNQLSPDTAWVANGPQSAGQRAFFSVTDTASAARYGLQVASLSRAGDDNTDRSFIAPDANGLLAGARAMTASAVAGVLQPQPATTVAEAYPLTMLTYAATTPRSLDAQSRTDYANFVTYSVGPGQVPGLQFGALPPGYAPLPATLVAQATAAAALIKSGDPAPVQPATVATTSPPTTSAPTASISAPPPSSGDTTTAAPPATTIAPVTPAVTQPPSVALKVAPSVARSRTPFEGVGAIRFMLLIAAIVSVLAAAGARVLTRGRGRKSGKPSSGPLEAI